jgi:hypothetical protein
LTINNQVDIEIKRDNMNTKKSKLYSLAMFTFTVGLTGCSGSSVANVTTTTVLEKPFGVSVISQALPSALELPSGWTASGAAENSASGTLEPRSGNGFGICGGPNRDTLLQELSVVAWAWSPKLKSEKGGSASIGAFEFPTAEAAKNFIEKTATQASCGSLNYTAVELGEGVTPSKNSNTPRFNGFSGSDNSTKWEVRNSYTVGGKLASTATTGITTQLDIEYIAVKNGTNFGLSERYVIAFEQHLNIVIRYQLAGECCVYGYSNSEASPEDLRSSLSELNTMAEQFRPGILKKLGLEDSVISSTSTSD